MANFESTLAAAIRADSTLFTFLADSLAPHWMQLPSRFNFGTEGAPKLALVYQTISEQHEYLQAGRSGLALVRVSFTLWSPSMALVMTGRSNLIDFMGRFTAMPGTGKPSNQIVSDRPTLDPEPVPPLQGRMIDFRCFYSGD